MKCERIHFFDNSVVYSQTGCSFDGNFLSPSSSFQISFEEQFANRNYYWSSFKLATIETLQTITPIMSQKFFHLG